MLTTRTISTIHYCEPILLKNILDNLIDKNIISFYAFVSHFKESDETKNHIHLFMEPSKRVDTIVLRNEFDIPVMNEKPIRCLPIVCSKFGDWFMYGCHDKAYLLSLGQSREFHYSINDFVCSDFDYFNELIHKIDRSRLNANQVIIDALENNIPFSQLLRNGQVPVQQINQWKLMYELLCQNNVPIRSSYTHDNFIVDDNGEIHENNDENNENSTDLSIDNEFIDFDKLPF